MDKRWKILSSEGGQSIVLVAILMVGLLAFAGLAIDGGNLFLQRRNTQNAADAAALAGTRVLASAICGHADASDADIANAVYQFTLRNGMEDLEGLAAQYTDIQEKVLGQVGAGSIPVSSTGISVTLPNDFPTYFIKVIGIPELDVSADALAMTGPAVAVARLWPVAVPLEMVDQLTEGDSFRLNFGNCSQPDQCIVSYTGGQVQHRGWLNLGYMWNDGTSIDENPDWPRAVDASGDADIIKQWMADGYTGGASWTGDYIHAKPGKDAAIIREATLGQLIVVPIFDGVPHYEAIPQPKAPKAEQGGGYYYHIAGYMAFEITGKQQGGGIIDGEFAELILGDGQSSNDVGTGYSQEEACRTHLQAVNLWR